MNQIAENIQAVRGRIEDACRSAGRNPSEVTVVAVTKKVDPGRIREAVEAGIPDLGENYVQEARQKLPLFGPDVRWHFVGHLQTNKAKYIPGAFHFVHSVDSVDLARELDRRAGQKEIVQNVLIEVKLDPSATKNGVVPAGLPGLAEAVWRFSNLRLLGLMGMAPIVPRPEEARPHFARLRELSEGLPSECRTVLSMGMSADFESAILEGSTMVRIGSAIFGLRRPH